MPQVSLAVEDHLSQAIEQGKQLIMASRDMPMS
jgi:hypothetical protein